MSLNVAYQRRLQSKYEMNVHIDYWYVVPMYTLTYIVYKIKLFL